MNYKMKFVLASKNQKKIAELSAILKEMDIEIIPMPETIGEIEENGTSFEENALIKAKTVMETTGLPAIADDSGLMVDALGGEPGIYSARYAGEGKTDKDRNDLLLKNMSDVPQSMRQGKFVCCIACVFPDKAPIIVRGECKGEILFGEQGTGGFGYDPLFYVPENNCTYAELPADVKNQISHRAQALNKLKIELKNRSN